MNDAKQSMLKNRFPVLYRNIGNPKSCMSYGLEVGDGWYELLLALSEDLQRLDPTLVATQVKQKFGTLRFYLAQSDLAMRGEAGAMFSLAPQASDERVRARIQQAEKDSAGICEECGAPGHYHQGGYWHVSCERCEPNFK